MKQPRRTCTSSTQKRTTDRLEVHPHYFLALCATTTNTDGCKAFGCVFFDLWIIRPEYDPFVVSHSFKNDGLISFKIHLCSLGKRTTWRPKQVPSFPQTLVAVAPPPIAPAITSLKSTGRVVMRMVAKLLKASPTVLQVKTLPVVLSVKE